MVTIKNVRWVPELGKNLFSFKAAANYNFEIITTKQYVKIVRDNQIHAYGYWDNNLYKMKFRQIRPSQAFIAQKISLKLLHERMGHASINAR